SFEGIVGHEKVSVKSRVKRIWDNFKKKSNVLFKELFIGTKTRPEAVASFLAVLELIKLKKIVVEYSEDVNVSNPKIYKNSSESDFDIGTSEEIDIDTSEE
ncbi:MAG: hypothetical protein RR145_03745, partial [Oscillospiraceae bacterium]